MRNVPSRLRSRFWLLALPLKLLSSQSLPADVTLSVTPSSVSNSYAGYLTLQISGLTNGETVVMEKFIDANTNGTIDAGDFLTQSFRLTDGQASLIGGVTNINVPGDATPANGAITARVNFSAAQPDHFTGQFALKLSSPGGRFVPVTNMFTITNSGYAQAITGTVRTSGTNLPHAVIVVLGGGAGQEGSFVGGAVADNAGNFRFNVLPGSYLVFAGKSNFVADLGTAPVVTLAAGETSATDLTVLPATRSITGRIFDAANTNIPLPGVFLHPESTNNLIALCWTDRDGNFTAGVTASRWQLSPQEQDVALHGYLVPNNEGLADTTSGNVSNVNFALTKGTALFYGSFTDELNPFVGVECFADDNNNLFESVGWTDSNGNYAVVTAAGGWYVGASSDEPRLAGYVVSQGAAANFSTGQAVRVNFTARRATNQITGYIKDNNNSPLADLDVNADADINGTTYRTRTRTDGTGQYSLAVANGTWSVNLDCNGDDGLIARGYCCVNGQSVGITNNNGAVNFTPVTSGQILITTASPLPSGTVGDFYQLQFAASGCATPFNWSLSPGSPPLPAGLSLGSDGTLDGFPNTAGSNYFSVRVTDTGNQTADKFFSLTLTNGPTASDVTLYYVFKQLAFRQTDALNVVLDTNADPYHGYLGIVQSTLGVVSIANVTLPTSAVKGFPSGASAIELLIHDSFSSQGAFDSAYPAGNYSFSISAFNDGNQFPVLTMPVPTYPGAPRVSNFSAAQSINPANSFLLQWDAFAGGTSNDTIFVLIRETNGTPVFSTPYPSLDFAGALKGTATSTLIPAGTLQMGRAYAGAVSFSKLTGINTAAYPGALGVTLAGARTSFSLATVSPAPTLGQPAKTAPTQFRFRLTGIAGQNYTIQRSTNLASTNWSSLFVTNAPATSFFVVDPNATNGRAFYRALFGP